RAAGLQPHAGHAPPPGGGGRRLLRARGRAPALAVGAAGRRPLGRPLLAGGGLSQPAPRARPVAGRHAGGGPGRGPAPGGRRGRAAAGFSGFLAAGAAFAYWPTMPLVVLPLAVMAAAAWRHRIDTRALAAFAVGAATVVLLGSPTVLADSVRSVLRAHRTAV